MKIHYDKETDSLYIDLSSNKSIDSKEIADGVVVDFDTEGNIVGIDIDQASKIVDFQELVSNLPLEQERLSA